MKTMKYTNVIDRSDWGSGEWDTEPIDKLQWRDEATELPVMIKRGPMGAWCGYVGIENPDHPWFEAKYEHPNVEVHGGLTFSEFCDEEEGPDGERICHVIEEGDVARVWWLGFDTGHYQDLVPGFPKEFAQVLSGTYKNQAYVIAETLDLARQVADES